MSRILATACGLLGVAMAGSLRGQTETTAITVDGAQRHQVIHGFGTCLKSWGNPEKDAVSKWQASPEARRLYAADLGLAVTRIPLSPWVLEGKNPYGIPTTLTDEMVSDPTQITYTKFSWRNTGRAAGAPSIALEWVKGLQTVSSNLMVIGSVWSPPHWMKTPASGGPGAKLNWSQFGANTCGGRLNPKYYTHYAHYLAAWVVGLKSVHGIELAAVSLQNELSFYEPYDSCVYTPEEFATVVKEVGRVFREKGIGTRIMGPEDMTKFADRTMGFVRAVQKDPDAAQALNIICSHGYADGIDVSLDSTDAARLWQSMQQVCPGKEYWMTETGAGTAGWQNIEVAAPKGKAGGTTTRPGAMGMFGGMLHNALVYGHASLWTTWQFLDAKPDYDAGLVFADMEKMTPTKKYYVQKHYARFIPPGTHRIEAGPDGQGGLLVSAYAETAKGVLTLVLQNHATQERTVAITLRDVPATASLALYVTDAERNCERLGDVPVANGACTLRLPARAMATLTTVKD